MNKGRKILVIYLGKANKESFEAIKNETEAIGVFDDIKIYTDTSMNDTEPQYHLNKPTILLEVMNYMEDDDILMYSESIIPDKKELKKWLKIVARNSSIFFFQGDTMNEIVEILMHDFYYKAKLLPSYRFDGSFFLLKKSSQYLIEEWREILSFNQSNRSISSSTTSLRHVINNHMDDPMIKIIIRE